MTRRMLRRMRSRPHRLRVRRRHVRPAGSAPAAEQKNGDAASRPARQVFKGPVPPPPLTERDITRLKLAEYPLDGEPQTVHVEFTKKRGEPTIESLVEKAIADSRAD